MSDQELRDELASKWTRGSNRHGHENIYASPNESFCAGWDAARANEVFAQDLFKAIEERDQLREEVERLKSDLLVADSLNPIAEDKEYIAYLEMYNSQLREEVERLKGDHAKFCEEAQEKTDADFKVVRDAAERAIKERDQLRAEVDDLKLQLHDCRGDVAHDYKAMAERLAEALAEIVTDTPGPNSDFTDDMAMDLVTQGKEALADYRKEFPK